MGKTWRVTADRNGSDGICKLETVDFVAWVVEEKGQSPNQRCCPAVFWGRRSLGLSFPREHLLWLSSHWGTCGLKGATISESCCGPARTWHQCGSKQASLV